MNIQHRLPVGVFMTRFPAVEANDPTVWNLAGRTRGFFPLISSQCTDINGLHHVGFLFAFLLSTLVNNNAPKLIEKAEKWGSSMGQLVP